MHIPRKFQQENIEELIALMRDYPFATLVTYSELGIEANHLPVSLSQTEDKLYVHAHIAKANPVWKSAAGPLDVLVIFNGPNCYISPNNYPTKKETGRAVPTWNYVAVHVKGKVSFIEDPTWIYNAIETLTAEHESDQDTPWKISDAPESYIKKMLPAVVGVEIAVESITGQWKLSQNQPEVNQMGVVEGLSKKNNENNNQVVSMIRSIKQHEQ